MSTQRLTYPDADRGASLAATYIAGCALSLIFVAMRLCARFSIAGVGIDDFLMLITWVRFSSINRALSSSFAAFAYGLLDRLPPSDYTHKHTLL